MPSCRRSEIETERLELAFLANWAMRAELAPAASEGDLVNLRRILPDAADDADLARLAELAR